MSNSFYFLQIIYALHISTYLYFFRIFFKPCIEFIVVYITTNISSGIYNKTNSLMGGGGINSAVDWFYRRIILLEKWQLAEI